MSDSVKSITPALQVEGLNYVFQGKQALHNISLTAERGDLTFVIGPNGAGKSTLFRCILNILTDFSGQIRVGGKDIRSMSARERAEQIAYIPQIHRPTFGYSVLDTVLMGMARQIPVFSRPGESQIRQAEEALDRIGVLHMRDRDFSKLSGGEQQLVLIARAIAQKAKILIMDEPTSALDFGNQLRVLRQVQALSRAGYTVLLSTHNPQQAMNYAGKVLAMSQGEVKAYGPPEKILTPQLIRELFGVEVRYIATESGAVIVPVGDGAVPARGGKGQ